MASTSSSTVVGTTSSTLPSSNLSPGSYPYYSLFVFFEIERFNLSFDSYVFLIRVASTVDAVLLSHPDTLHLGALPYAMKQLGLSAPVYATEPVHRLGLLTMYDQYLSRKVKSFAALFIFFNYSASCHFLRCANTMIVLFAASLRL